MTIQFKTISPNDLSTVLDLFKEAALKIDQMGIDHWQYWKQPPLEKINWVKEGIAQGQFLFVQSKEFETLGMVRIMTEDLPYWGPKSDKAKYIHSLVIRGNYNGQGMGKRVMDAIEQTAKDEGFDFLRLDAVSGNTKLCNYYKNIGFKAVGVKEFPDGANTLFEKALS